MQGADDGAFGYTPFVRVGPRKKRNGRDVAGACTTPSDLLVRAQRELATDTGWSLGCHDMIRRALLRGVGDKPERVLCLGLGSPSSSRDARAQLALLCYLCDALDISTANVSVYDPVFTDGDGRLFETLGMKRLDPIQGGEYSVNGPTILYMPHCEVGLYENVVRANWTLDGLCNVLFIANAFTDYAGGKFEGECPFLLKLVPFVQHESFAESRAFPNAFNNLSVQYVNRTLLSLQGRIFWEKQGHGKKE